MAGIYCVVSSLYEPNFVVEYSGRISLFIKVTHSGNVTTYLFLHKRYYMNYGFYREKLTKNVTTKVVENVAKDEIFLILFLLCQDLTDIYIFLIFFTNKFVLKCQ